MFYKDLTKINSYYLLFLVQIIVILLSLFNYGKPSIVTNLGGAYLVRAVELYGGNFPSYYHRGPVYPYLLAFSFNFGGVSFAAAHWLTQTIYFLTVGVTFVLVNSIYGKWAAFISAISVILSVSLFSVSWNLGVAFLWPLFILVSFFFYLKSISEKRKYLLFLSGFVFGLALLTKESSLFYIYFPFLLMIGLSDYRSKFVFKNIYLFFFGIAVLLVPWILFFVVNDQSLSSMLGEFKTGGISFFGYSSLFIYLIDISVTGSLATAKALFAGEPFSPIMFLGLCYSFYSASRNKNRADRIFLSLFLPSIPLLLGYGLFLDGFRQIVLPVILLHISLGRLIVTALQFGQNSPQEGQLQ